MITHFNIPEQAQINTPISKTMFADKGTLSAPEKRMLREDVVRISMRALLQTRTVGLAASVDEQYAFDQIVIAEVLLRSTKNIAAIATMFQRKIPAHMVLVLQCGDSYAISWCTKRINQTDREKRVLEDLHLTRLFLPREVIVSQWLTSLDIRKISCNTLKELFQTLTEKLLKLRIADEIGTFSEETTITVDEYHQLLNQLKSNREEQSAIQKAIKQETQANRQGRLVLKLKELQIAEKSIINKMK